MGRKGRKFIDKNKDIVHTFKVISRSQRDPLVADENAPQGVLITSSTSKTTKEETHDYGVIFDDDYDYLQHLRGTKEAIDWENCDLEVYTLRKQDKKASKKDHEKFGLVFPSSAFESYLEEPVGLLNKAAPVSGPQPDIDPDIVAELDRLELEGETGEEIPDDFFVLMNSEEPIEALEDEIEEGQHSNINAWLNCEEEYDDIPALESSVDESRTYYGRNVSKDDQGFTEEINKERNINILYETDDEYEDITDDEDSDVNVSDDEHEQKTTSASSNDFNDRHIYKKPMKHMQHEYDPLGYGGNSTVQDYDDERRDVLKGLPSKRNLLGNEVTSQTSRTSHSCSHLPRTELLSWLDKRFQYVYENEYSKDQWGALDDQDIEGHVSVDSEVFQQIMSKTKIQIEKRKNGVADDTDRDKIVNWIRQGRMQGKNYQKEEYETINVPDRENYAKYNCENILPLRAKYVNEPEVLDCRPVYPKININSRRGYPLLLEKSQLTKKALAELDQENTDTKEDFETETLKSRLSLVSYRPPNETPEDRRDRKKAVKALRRERRIEKKYNKEAFKEEKKLQIKTEMNLQRNKKISLC